MNDVSNWRLRNRDYRYHRPYSKSVTVDGIKLCGRDQRLLQALMDCRLRSQEAIAEKLELRPGTLKLYLSQLYKRVLGDRHGSRAHCMRLFMLWVFLHKQEMVFLEQL